MATVRVLDGAIGIEPRSSHGGGFFNRLADYLNAIREGSAACRTYNELVLNGTPHDEAVQQVFKKHFSR